MKSRNNNTEYDDKLFYQAITASAKKLFICPVDKPYDVDSTSLKVNESYVQALKIEKTGTFPVKASAAGKIKTVQNWPDQTISIEIEHENGLLTTYSKLIKSEAKEGNPVKQGDVIGHAKEYMNFILTIASLQLFQED